MKTQTTQLTPQLKQLTEKYCVLLESRNVSKKRDTIQLNLSGYSDVMFLIADIVKVSILALEGSESHSSTNIPEPSVNITGVLGIILDLIPYEEADLLDLLRESVLDNSETATIIDDDIYIENFFITPPSDLYENNKQSN